MRYRVKVALSKGLLNSGIVLICCSKSDNGENVDSIISLPEKKNFKGAFSSYYMIFLFKTNTHKSYLNSADSNLAFDTWSMLIIMHHVPIKDVPCSIVQNKMFLGIQLVEKLTCSFATRFPARWIMGVN